MKKILIVLTVFIVSEARSVTNEYVGGLNYTKAGMDTYLNFAPTRLLKLAIADVKVLNMAQFNKINKGTKLLKATAAIRGQMLVKSNNAARMALDGAGKAIKVFGILDSYDDINGAANQTYKKQ